MNAQRLIPIIPPANDNGPRFGYVLAMWTGLFPRDDNDLPTLFPTIASALAYVSRCPSWGRHAVTVYECTVRHGVSAYGNTRPDYILGDPVANGLEAAERTHR